MGEENCVGAGAVLPGVVCVSVRLISSNKAKCQSEISRLAPQATNF